MGAAPQGRAGVGEGGVGGSGQVTAGSIRCFVREETSYFVSLYISLFLVTLVDRCKGRVSESGPERGSGGTQAVNTTLHAPVR